MGLEILAEQTGFALAHDFLELEPRQTSVYNGTVPNHSLRDAAQDLTAVA